MEAAEALKMHKQIPLLELSTPPPQALYRPFRRHSNLLYLKRTSKFISTHLSIKIEYTPNLEEFFINKLNYYSPLFLF